MSKRRKPTKDTLDQYIYDYGLDRAMVDFGLTEKMVEGILFSPVIDRRMVKKFEIEDILEVLIDVDLEVAFPVYMAIRDNYSHLKKKYIHTNDLRKLNVRGESPEDKFHDALIRIMTNLDRFQYIDDDTTLKYVESRLYFENKTDKKSNQRAKGKGIFQSLIDENFVEQLTNTLQYEESN